MKRFLSLFIAATIALCDSAEGVIKQSIIIDPSTFRPVQTDQLTGVNIDPIRPDLSRRPCARIKIFFHQMTREQMGLLEAIYPSGSIQGTKCKVAEGNTVLILEMTAKPATKFYLTHPKFGTSNEVEFNLEGNKEYQLEATLNKQLTINIASNVEGASVYLNNEFKGTTAAPNNICTIADLFQGTYDLRLEYGDRKSESKIEVIDGSNIYFRLDIDDTAPVYQYLVINTNPKSALVEIDGKSIQRKNGKVEVRLTKGVHNYRISADDYYTTVDTVVLDGSRTRTMEVALNPAFGFLKVEHASELKGAEVYVNNRLRGTLPLEKPIPVKSGQADVRIVKNLYHDYNTTLEVADNQTYTLKADLVPNFAKVTITTDATTEIWIDGQKRGTGKWSGELEIGKYTIDCQKMSHEPAHHLLSVVDTNPISVNYGALKPIYGSLDISCNVDGAKYYIDDIEIGTLPFVDNAVLVGTRTVKIAAPGYKSHVETVEVKKGETVAIAAELKAGSVREDSQVRTNSSTLATQKGKKNLIQLGLGFEYGFSSGFSTLNVPVEMRIGRCDQLINGFVGLNYMSKSTEYGDSSSADVDMKGDFLSAVAKIRFNAKRSNTSSFYIDAGAKYNFVTSTKYTTNYIDLDTESYTAGIESTTDYKIDSKPSLTALLSLGYGFSLLDLYCYAMYDINSPYRDTDASNYVVGHRWKETATTLSDYTSSGKFMSNSFIFGLGVKIYIGSGFIKNR